MRSPQISVTVKVMPVARATIHEGSLPGPGKPAIKFKIHNQDYLAFAWNVYAIGSIETCLLDVDPLTESIHAQKFE